MADTTPRPRRRKTNGEPIPDVQVAAPETMDGREPSPAEGIGDAPPGGDMSHVPGPRDPEPARDFPVLPDLLSRNTVKPKPEPDKPAPEGLPAGPARLPRNLIEQVDYVLHNPDTLIESIRGDHDLWPLTRSLFLLSMAMAGVYGVVMGATNWLQGGAFPFTWDLVIMIATGIKVPVLLFLSLVIVVPPVYVSGTFLGSRASFSQVVTLMFASMTIMTLALASMASVAFFFSLTTGSYHFIVLMHVLFFSYTGIVGVAYLARGFRAIVGDSLGKRTWVVFVGWLLLYGFVGMQLAWELRPFVGKPGMAYTLFREHEMSFYESVWRSLVHVLSGG